MKFQLEIRLRVIFLMEVLKNRSHYSPASTEQYSELFVEFVNLFF